MHSRAWQGLEVDEDYILNVVKHIKRESRANLAGVQAMLVDCAAELSTKLPLYTLLLGEAHLGGGQAKKTRSHVQLVLRSAHLDGVYPQPPAPAGSAAKYAIAPFRSLPLQAS